jgi:rubrerythrin
MALSKFNSDAIMKPKNFYNPGGSTMNQVKLQDVIMTAIKREEDAYAFYQQLSTRFTDKAVVETLTFLKDEEKRHKEFLEGYLKGDAGSKGLRMDEVIDYRIAEHLEKPDVAGKLESQDVYLIAAHRELNAFHFYSELAATQPEGEIREVFLRMANEEKRHKEKMEYLYANTAFPQTAGG